MNCNWATEFNDQIIKSGKPRLGLTMKRDHQNFQDISTRLGYDVLMDRIWNLRKTQR